MGLGEQKTTTWTPKLGKIMAENHLKKKKKNKNSPKGHYSTYFWGSGMYFGPLGLEPYVQRGAGVLLCGAGVFIARQLRCQGLPHEIFTCGFGVRFFLGSQVEG